MGKKIKSWSTYTDEDNVNFAKGEYGNYKPGKVYYAGKNSTSEPAGYVQERFGFNKNGSPNADYNGAQAYVVTPQNHQNPKNVKEVAVVYQGSDTQFKKADKVYDSAVDWGGNDIPMALEIGEYHGELTPQMRSSTQILNDAMKKYPNAKVRVYGHSLGCMDVQAAVASCDHPHRIETVYGYEGPNIYDELSPKQQRQADKLKNKINLYVDQKDVVGVGYSLHKHMGQLYNVQSANKFPSSLGAVIKEHMFGGYQFSNGKLKCNKIDRTSNTWLDVADSALGVSEIGIVAACILGAGSEIDAGVNEINAIASKVISTVQEEGGVLNTLITAKKELLEKNYTTMKKMARSIGTDLSSGEIESALSEVSATKSNMVTKPEAKFEKSAKEMKSLISKMESYGAKLSSGAESYVSTDNATASDIGSITSPTALFN